MSFKMDRVHVWSAEVEDRPGGTASKLAILAQAGANLEYIFTKRLPNKPGKGVLYVAPISGPSEVTAAKQAGLHEVDDPVVHRIEGDNRAGLAHHLTQAWAMATVVGSPRVSTSSAYPASGGTAGKPACSLRKAVISRSGFRPGMSWRYALRTMASPRTTLVWL